jgi:isopentenyl diphosphate isomerase/L-lactate dehydrogenase-like FMN-dependent dehydrogenase
MALPLIRDVRAGGAEAVLGTIERVRRVVEAVMVLTGCREVADLRKAALWREPGFQEQVRFLRGARDLPQRMREEHAG